LLECGTICVHVMLIILSPAKTLDFTALGKEAVRSSACGLPEAHYLGKELQKLSEAKLKTLLKVSDNISRENHERYQNWGSQPEKQAMFAYSGAVYQALKAAELSPEEVAFAQDHVRILSGLYGYLRPLDMIQPYRLEMSSKLKTEKAKNLYAYWQDKILEYLEKELLTFPEEEQFLINCASQEYAKVVKVKELSVPVYAMSFPGPSMYAKSARGAMARFIIQRSVSSPETLKDFKGNEGEWAYDPSSSSDREFVFTREKPVKRRKQG